MKFLSIAEMAYATDETDLLTNTERYKEAMKRINKLARPSYENVAEILNKCGVDYDALSRSQRLALASKIV